MSSHVLTWSTFLREPASVEKWLTKGDVLLRRREGETLRLSRESSDASLRDALQAIARLLGSSAHRLRHVSREEVGERLPWTRFLPAEDRATFITEFLDTLEASADLGDFTALARLVDDWKATATLHAQGLAPKLSGALRGGGARVRRP